MIIGGPLKELDCKSVFDLHKNLSVCSINCGVSGCALYYSVFKLVVSELDCVFSFLLVFCAKIYVTIYGSREIIRLGSCLHLFLTYNPQRPLIFSLTVCHTFSVG